MTIAYVRAQTIRRGVILVVPAVGTSNLAQGGAPITQGGVPITQG